MPLMRIDVWPSHLLRFVSATVSLGSLNGSVQPLFQAAPQVFADPFEQRWIATFQSPPMPEKEITQADRLAHASWREVEGRVARLRGMARLLRLYDPYVRRPAFDLEQVPVGANFDDGSAFSDGSQWVSGFLPPFVTVDETAHEGAESIVVRGLPVSTSRVLRIGDRFEARPGGIAAHYGMYFIVVNDCKTNSAGKVRIYFEPGLRRGLKAGDMIVLRDPTSVYSLIDDRQGAVNRNVASHGEYGFSLVERLPSDA